MNRRVVHDMLHVAGVPVVEADGGANGIARLEAKRDIDVVLLDLRMPEMDGFEVIRRIRAREDDLADMPIIVVTADVAPGIEEECLATGADAVLFKPIAMLDMYDRIAQVYIAKTDPDRILG